MKTIYSIISQSNDPSFNLAAEEYLLRNKNEDYHFFYINKPSVIVGKHQNALAEINIEYLEKNNISLHRRLSGGGTVYHDEGNLNFCFIKNGNNSNLVNFKQATQPIVEALNSWNIPARNGERNDLLVNYKKISGNACHVYKRRVMHHGTLLYNSNLDALTSCLKNDPLKFKDKAVKSVRSEVINIKTILNKNWSSTEFLKRLVEYIKSNLTNIESYTFTENDLIKIHDLQESKYSKNDWNLRYGPNYEFKKRAKSSGFIFAIKMIVKKGKITDITIKTNYPDKNINDLLIDALKFKNHDKKTIKNNLKEIIHNYNLDESTIIDLFF